MRQTALMVAAFAATFGLLGIGFFAFQSIQGQAQATPSAAPTSRPTAGAAATPTRRPTSSSNPTPAPTPSVAPSTRPVAAASATASVVQPSASAQPTPGPTEALPTPSPSASPPSSSAPPPPTATPSPELVVTLRGDQYESAIEIDDALLSVGPDGSLTIETDRSSNLTPFITYRVPLDRIPAFRPIRTIDVRVCGTGSGDFWETYGPEGSEPFEWEGTAPAQDGCWHFTGAPGPDTTVLVSQHLGTRQTIVMVEYTIRFGA